NTPFEFTIGFRAQLANTAINGEHLTLSNLDEINEDVYSLLVTFNFGPDDGNIYVILSNNQIFIYADKKNLLWSSPLITITDTTWHRLQLIFHSPISIKEQNGPDVEHGLQVLVFFHFFFVIVIVVVVIVIVIIIISIIIHS
ncbi:unnamed protein product, partial [Schistosoma mattheei]